MLTYRSIYKYGQIHFQINDTFSYFLFLALAEQKLSQTKIKIYLNEIIDILNNEIKQNRILESIKESLCLDYIIQSNIIREFCIRSINDTPRGFLPLILVFLFKILENIDYLILSNISIYKPVENLINSILINRKMALKNSHISEKIYNDRIGILFSYMHDVYIYICQLYVCMINALNILRPLCVCLLYIYHVYR
jgi:hypothetical protein